MIICHFCCIYIGFFIIGYILTDIIAFIINNNHNKYFDKQNILIV